ncbi:MAG: CBS domain-containing protein [Symploca sp. SIO3C6]|uniref:CBS domain-containing protein n=1 Tax=Symploca sp. SIO1C4 TaxID=2607765 RepID=A0A6B3NED9_9CYAN|nr:CBS domain-containing protein [Symploca sp. SIO3C6]NER29950.1 CBS domain-containing protein [Symploca sp. SIO1C4]NET04326.1 CBS domain-containing protein [Symploca sp. SIO2B6]
MNKDVATIRGAATVAQAVGLMKEKGLNALIVDRTHDQDAYGIVTATDVIRKVVAFGKDPQQVRVYEIMTKPCIVANPDLGVEYVARLFVNTGICQAPIIQGGLLGVISIADILTKSDFLEKPQALMLAQKIREGTENARAICEQKGSTSQECSVAWNVVEELQAEAAHQLAQKLPKTAFEEYSEENSEVLSAQQYDNWCSG